MFDQQSLVILSPTSFCILYSKEYNVFTTHSSYPFPFVSASTLYSSNTQHDLVSGKHSYKVCSGRNKNQNMCCRDSYRTCNYICDTLTEYEEPLTIGTQSQLKHMIRVDRADINAHLRIDHASDSSLQYNMCICSHSIQIIHVQMMC